MLYFMLTTDARFPPAGVLALPCLACPCLSLPCCAGDSVWTGLFYVLREDGSFSSFPSKDIRGQTPVKVRVQHRYRAVRYRELNLVDEPSGHTNR